MKRWWVGLSLLVVCVGLAVWWLTRDEDIAATADQSLAANEGAVPDRARQSKWNEPIAPRGSRKVSGVVLREGAPVVGATVTALAAHGDDVLSDLPCQCDNSCGQMLLACGCAEAAGQLVELVGERTGEGAPLGRATSGADGTFTLEGLDDTKLTLWADAPGGIAWRTDVASDAQDVKLELRRGRMLKGTVKTTRGGPASGALVTAIFSEQSRFFDAITRADGTFEVGPMPAGKYAVVAMQAGLLPDHKQVTDGDDDIELELSVPRALSGVVLRDDAPVPGATVKLDGMHRKRTLVTDAKGEFRIENLRPGRYDLSASAPGALGSTEAKVNKREDREGVAIVLQAGVPLDGVVLDERGSPVADAKVNVDSSADWSKTTSAGDGRFHFDTVLDGPRKLWAQKDGYLSVEDLEVIGGGAPVTVTMTRASIISGSVRTTDGVLVTDFHIVARRADAGVDGERHGSSDDAESTDGGFALELLPGEYALRVDPDTYVVETVVARAPREGLVITVKPGATVKGLVLDADGVPAANVTVVADARSAFKRTQSDVDGRFTMRGLEAGHWSFTARHSKTGSYWVASAELELGERTTTELVLRPKSGARIAGVVIDEKGAPVEGATVSGVAERPSIDGGSALPEYDSATTDAKGAFAIKTLSAGQVSLRAMRKGGPSANVTTTAPDEKVILKLAAVNTVSGRVLDDTGKPVVEFTVSHSGVEAEDGRFKVPSRKGPQHLAIDAVGFAQYMFDVDVKDGDNDVGDLKLSRGVQLSGQVLDAVTQAPIPNALVDVSNKEPNGGIYLGEELGAVRSDAKGRFTLAAVDASSTWLAVTHEDYAPLTVRRPSGSTVNLLMKRGATLVAHVVDAQGQPVKDARVVASRAGADIRPARPISPAGTFEARGLNDGEWFIQVSVRSGATYRSVTQQLHGNRFDVTLREATDGVDVHVVAPETVLRMMLFSGTITTPDDLLKASSGYDVVRVNNGVAKHVLPGTWTLIGYSQTSMAVQPVEVTTGANQVQFTPVWKPVR